MSLSIKWQGGQAGAGAERKGPIWQIAIDVSLQLNYRALQPTAGLSLMKLNPTKPHTHIHLRTHLQTFGSLMRQTCI